MSEKKENVSIDEMMQSLKRGNSSEPTLKPHLEENPEGEGKLVTRADGSKAIKVKTRKRRSHQPKKEIERKSVRNKVILITTGIITCLLAGIAFTVLLAYYNGTKFNEKLTSTVENQSGAEVKLEKLEVSLGNAKMHRMSFDWQSPASTIDYLKLDGIIADYGVFSFFKGSWSGAEVLADTGELKLTLQENPDQIKPSGEASVDFDFESYKCRSLNATLGEKGHWKLENSQASLSISENGGNQIYLYGGVIKAPFFQEYKIRSGVVEVKPNESEVSLVLLSGDERGTLSLAGKVGYKAGSKINLKTKFENILLDGWMDHRVKRFMNGKISKGEGSLSMSVGNTVDKVAVTHVKSDAISLSNFEFIQTLGSKMKDDYYVRPSFQSESKMTIKWLKDRTVVENIRLEEKGDFIITGNFTVQNSGSLSGKLKLGIPMEKLNASELLQLRKVFKEETDEVIWTEITLSGSVAIPTDDLASQFDLAKGIQAQPKDASEAEFDSLNLELSE